MCLAVFGPRAGRSHRLEACAISSVAFAGVGKVVVGDIMGRIHVWSTNTKRKLFAFPEETGCIWLLDAGEDYVLASTATSTIRMYNFAPSTKLSEPADAMQQMDLGGVTTAFSQVPEKVVSLLVPPEFFCLAIVYKSFSCCRN
ncbi:hypothetical protein CYMTET_9549 [Cymbomonas tetramitiformis]|uniref:Uncharacterized protein n=1 Tax=Cymbomonas tetramitiformis TaxID=36881 RepID=A0AAE0LF09_9CHLO|nr:hypothetical protein CYMTET_9549 [Cymbomonas tetramitiformis]